MPAINTHIIGYGQMGSAIAKLLQSTVNKSHSNKSSATQDFTFSMKVYDTDQKAVDRAKKDGFEAVPLSLENPKLTDFSSASKYEIILLAIKPQGLVPFLKRLPINRLSIPHFVSIAAGVTLHTIETALRDREVSTKADNFNAEDFALTRIMPNVACLIGKGAGGVSHAGNVTDEQKTWIKAITDRMGTFIEVDESLMDAVTALSGSGPAMIMTTLETMSDAGVQMGLKRQDAHALASATMIGSASLCEMETKGEREHPAVIREKVTSPGGTTIAGLAALESGVGGFRGALMAFFHAAYKRSKHLGRRAQRGERGKREHKPSLNAESEAEK